MFMSDLVGLKPPLTGPESVGYITGGELFQLYSQELSDLFIDPVIPRCPTLHRSLLILADNGEFICRAAQVCSF